MRPGAGSPETPRRRSATKRKSQFSSSCSSWSLVSSWLHFQVPGREGTKDTKRREEEKSVFFFVFFVELRVFVVAFPGGGTTKTRRTRSATKRKSQFSSSCSSWSFVSSWLHFQVPGREGTKDTKRHEEEKSVFF